MAYFNSTVWTPEKWARAQAMRTEGYRDEAIAEELHLTVSQVKTRFNNARKDQLGFGEVTDRQIAERDARKAAADARDQTAVFCGDPPKGFSALDKRRE